MNTAPVAWVPQGDTPWARGAATALAASGWRVALGVREVPAPSEEGIHPFLRGEGPEGLAACTVEAADRLGGFDALLPWSPLPLPSRLWLDLEERDWRAALDPLREDLAESLRCSLPYLLGKPGAQILFLLPEAPRGEIPAPQEAARLARFAVARSLREELDPFGVRVRVLLTPHLDAEAGCAAARALATSAETPFCLRSPR